MKLYAVMLSVVIMAVSTAAAAFFTGGPAAGSDTSHAAAVVTYEIDAGRSKFMVEAGRGGLAWFKGHAHHLAVRDFTGEARLDINALDPASLETTIRADSLEETSDEFTPQQKAIINKELDEIVLETAKYPDIRFKSTAVKGGVKNGVFEVEISGDIGLHGVTRSIVIPATVTVAGGELHAKGAFELDRTDFNVKATSAFHGMVRVEKKLKFTFDIVGRPSQK